MEATPRLDKLNPRLKAWIEANSVAMATWQHPARRDCPTFRLAKTICLNHGLFGITQSSLMVQLISEILSSVSSLILNLTGFYGDH